MTFFLHVPELEEGLNKASTALGTANDQAAEQKRLELLSTLQSMRTFAESNLSSMLHMMGFDSIDELNLALQNYNHLNLSLQQIFPAFSEPQISEILIKAGFDKVNTNTDYQLIISALQDTISSLFSETLDKSSLTQDFSGWVAEKINEPSFQDAIAAGVAARLFGGITATDLVIDIMNGKVSDPIGKLVTQIGKNAAQLGVTKTSSKTLMPFMSFLKTFLQEKSTLIINESNYDQVVTKLIEANSKIKINKDILKSRIKRGGFQVNSKVKVNTSIKGDAIVGDFYLDNLTVNIDPSFFDINARAKNESIENYVNRLCEENPQLYKQLQQNIKDYYWKLIEQHLPSGLKSPLERADFDGIIDQMTAPTKEKGNIGWFFSQSSSKALGSGMFGEIAGMIYMRVLCPNLKGSLQWAGGVTDGAKPPADIILEAEGKKYGIQIKNYTSGSTLSAEYNLLIRNIVDSAAESSKNSDFMTTQVVHELGITEEEIEAIQNIIIAKVFNVPYKKIGNAFQQVGSVLTFMDAYNRTQSTYLQATRYLAIISLIMHRVQYYEDINRQVGAGRIENQIQNTLWLINGSMFVSSVQIFDELIKYIDDTANRFFGVSASVRISEKNAQNFGLTAGKMTIVEYLNMNARGLGTTALSKVSASIGTNYRMSAFHG